VWCARLEKQTSGNKQKRTWHRPSGMAQAQLATVDRLKSSHSFGPRGRVSFHFHPGARHSRDCADGSRHHWTRDRCCTPRVREKSEDRPGFVLPFILEALGAFARPAPDTEPNIEGKTYDPEGVPCTQWLSTCIPLVF